MHFWYQIFLNVAVIFHTCTIVLVLANESANCDCDVLQVDDPDGLIGYQNFTKQNQTRNGKPIYFSTQQNMIYWDNQYWSYDKYDADLITFKAGIDKYGLTLFSNENGCKKTNRSKIQKGIIIYVKSQCLRENRNCSATRELTRHFAYGSRVHQQVQMQAKNPCKFPFIYKDVTYNSCTKMDRNKLWCATTVDATNQKTSWGYCTDSCPMEDTGY